MWRKVAVTAENVLAKRGEVGKQIPLNKSELKTVRKVVSRVDKAVMEKKNNMASIRKGFEQGTATRLNAQNLKSKTVHAGTTLIANCTNELLGAHKSHKPSTDSESSR